MEKRWLGVSASVCAVLVLCGSGAVLAQPQMVHVWQLYKDTWGGACAGKATHLLTTSAAECSAANAAGYVGTCGSGDTNAEHYASSVSFTGGVKISRMHLSNACGCKSSYIYTHDESWKTTLKSQGWKEESQYYYAWPKEIGPLNEINKWGLVPVWHAYSSTYCDNYYTEHAYKYQGKIDSGKYVCGYEAGCQAYYAADGWVNVSISCSHPGCSWTLTGPGGWTINGSGTYSSPSKGFPSHGYQLQCNPLPGLKTKNADQKPYFTYFTSNQIKCEYECVNECSFANQKECVGSSYHVCQSDVNGCLKWGSLVSCDDGNPCTQGDGCQGGSCVVGTPMNCSYLSDTCNTGVCSGGQCVAQPKAGACNDNDPCTSNDSCQGGGCSGIPKDCSYLSDACNQGVCQGGACVAQPKSGSCNDGNACTEGDFCQNGKCQAGTPKDCSYLSDSCNTGSCSGGQCVAQPKSGACEDGNPCTLNDVCSGGKCTSGPSKDCSASADQCNNGVCVGGNCVKEPKAGVCSDQDSCTVGDACLQGVCVGAPMDCTLLSDACNVGVCVGGKCTAQPKAGSCDDGNACTAPDTCNAGKCEPGQQKDCSVLTDSCNDGVCVAGQCVAKAKDGKCEDGDLCTLGDWCVQGKCMSGAPLDCSLLTDSCKTGICVSGVCKGEPKPGMDCDDGIACTVDKCDPALGCLHTADVAPCDDGNPCTEDQCVPGAGGCVNNSVSLPCEDGNLCSVGDACIDGGCEPGTPKDCSDGSVCTDDSCVPATGECAYSANSLSCSDGNSCTSVDVCMDKACVGTAPLDCSDAIDCTLDSCDPAEGCKHQAQDVKCEDADPCTEKLCSAELGCLQIPNQAACTDGNPCTENDSCVEGICAAGGLKDCDDNNSCTKDVCVPETGACDLLPIDGTCNDGDVCTDGDSCLDGQCIGVAVEGCCKADGDCPNPNPECQQVTCVGGICKAEAYCAEGRCGPNECDPETDCGKCLAAIEVCVMDGWCKQKCNPADKNMTRCTDDGQSVEKCVLDDITGQFFWQATDCAAVGHAGCAFSKDKGIFVCCTPDCTGKKCGMPSACGMSCGTCPVGEFCCSAGEPCAQADAGAAFSCLDCCAGIECGPSLAEGCGQNCGTCPDSFVCKEGKCVSGCKDANIDAVGMCAGPVAWWCETTLGKEVLQSVDCSKFVATCCMDEELGKVGCCTCETECAEKGWECGMNTCGEKCGEFEGECGPGFACVPETHQCLCQNPSLCATAEPEEPGGDVEAGGEDSNHLVLPDESGADVGGQGGRESGGCHAGAAAPGAAVWSFWLLLALAVARSLAGQRQRVRAR